MALPWFKFYAEFLDDPKVQIMPVAMRYRLVALMCSHCKEEPRTDRLCGHRWACSDAEVQETKLMFIDSGFIDQDWNLVNWQKRQAVTSSAVRMKRWREKRDVSVTSPLRHSDADVTLALRHSDGYSDGHVTAEEDREEEQVRPEGKNYGF